MKKQQLGFTLIELIIALALGLLITAAAIMLFITGQKSFSMQQGVADIQDNANFGLNMITKDIRLVNLDNSKAYMDDQTALGGMVFTSSINAKKTTDTPPIPLSNLYKTIVGTTAGTNFLTQSDIALSNVQSAGTDLKSDQLTIQYMPEYYVEKRSGKEYYVAGFDCEGNELAFEKLANNVGKRIVVQRYFLRTDINKSPNEPNQSLALACDAGNYQPAQADGSQAPTSVNGFGGNGEIIMKRVDYFHVLLGVEFGDLFRYMPISEYMALAGNKPRIVTIQLGILSRSSQSVGRDAVIKDDQQFVVLDKTVTVKKPSSISAPKYVRQVVSQTIALRNALGERGS